MRAGNGARQKPDPNVTAADFRKILLQRLDDLRQSIDSTVNDRKPVELDPTSVGRLSRINSMLIQAMALAAERTRNLQIRRIEAALGRIDTGEFGYCVACGDAIPRKRLTIDPATPNCIGCAAGSG